MDRDAIALWLALEDATELFRQADAVRREVCGDSVHLRGLIEFSNICRRDCLYCGLRRSNTRLARYRMSADEIFDSARQAVGMGYKTLVLQSGEDPGYPVGELSGLIRKIKGELGCALTLCVGERRREEYREFKAAGADRYLLRFETSNRELFRQLKPDSSFDERMTCLRWLKELGFQVGSGIMVGLPGQTLDIIAEDLLLLRELDLDMIGIGPFIAHPDTPLNAAADGTIDLTLRVIALTRLLTKNTHMPATTAIGSLDPIGRQKALSAGANVIMPNVTPTKYRKLYELYPNKICVEDKPADCRSCVEGMLAGLGRKVAEDEGHSLKNVKT